MKKLFIGCALLLATVSLSLTAQDNKGQTDTRKKAQTECCCQNASGKDCDKKKCADCKGCSSKEACKQQCKDGKGCKDCPRKANGKNCKADCKACKADGKACKAGCKNGKAGCKKANAECPKKAQDCQKQCAGKPCKK